MPQSRTGSRSWRRVRTNTVSVCAATDFDCKAAATGLPLNTSPTPKEEPCSTRSRWNTAPPEHRAELAASLRQTIAGLIAVADKLEARYE